MQEKQITACYLPLKYNSLTFGMVSHELPGHSVFVQKQLGLTHTERVFALKTRDASSGMGKNRRS